VRKSIGFRSFLSFIFGVIFLFLLQLATLWVPLVTWTWCMLFKGVYYVKPCFRLLIFYFWN